MAREVRGRDLLAFALDPAANWWWRARAAKLLVESGERYVTQGLLEQFQATDDAEALWWTALILEGTNDATAIPSLLAALDPAHPDRCHAAARALGWIGTRSLPVADALALVLSERALPAKVRAEAAESIGYVNPRRGTPALVEALADPEPLVRFFAVFALGQTDVTRPTNEARAAIETLLGDDAVPDGWWSVRREALGVLGGEALLAEIALVEADPNATELDRNWAGFYSPHCPMPKAR